MKILWSTRAILLAVSICSLMVFVLGSSRGDSRSRVSADLSGFQEVPAISTTGHGEFRAKINERDQTIDYELSFEDLEGPVLVAHIHLAQKGVSGPVMIDLCGATKPACPPGGGTATGTIVPADVKALPNQGIEAMNFAEAVRAIRAGVTYANVHTTRFPGGEIRGQIKGHDNGNDED